MRRHRPTTTAAAFFLAAALVAGCASADEDAKFDSVGSAVDGGGGADFEEDISGTPSGDEAGDEAVSERDAPAPASEGATLYAGEADGLGDYAAPASTAPLAPSAGGTEAVDTEVRAGSIDDNELWDEYLLYRQEFFASGVAVSDVPVEGRQVLTVVDADGDPVLGATIEIRDEAGETTSRLRTYADGRALFLAPVGSDPDSQDRPRFTAQVTKGETTAEIELTSGALEQTLTLEADLPSPAKLDLVFLVDATGSMSDEIEQLKANMISVAEQIAALPSAPEARFSMVVYRDRGEEYVTRTFDFTGDVDAFVESIAEVQADAGGDTPESLNAGLHDAIAGPAWSEDAVKLVFLVADAPPHLAGEPGYEDEPDYADDVVEAAAAGIKIFPIASSGLDNQGEFIFRQLAQITMGRFVFLTYGADGASPGDSTSHHVDPEDYDVLALDDLVVQLVSDELASLG
jgi:hypothetical protein